MKNSITAVLAMSAGFAVMQAWASNWMQTAGGTYSWTDWDNWSDHDLQNRAVRAIFDNTLTGNQTITGNGTPSTLDVKNGTAGFEREFQGGITATNAVFRTGATTISGTLILTNGVVGTYSRVGTSSDIVNAASLCTLKISGTVAAPGVHAFCVGRNDVDDNNALGRLQLLDGGTFTVNPTNETATMSGLMLGASSGTSQGQFASSYLQDGGCSTLGRLMVACETGAVASVTMKGGVMELPYIGDVTRFRVGQNGYGVFQMFGGEVFACTNAPFDVESEPVDSLAFQIGSGLSKAGNSETGGLKGADFYAVGGSLICGGEFDVQGESFANNSLVAPASATVDGVASVTACVVRIGANAGDGRASLNLNGGELATLRLCGHATRGGRDEMNANGGAVSFPTNALVNQFLDVDAINVYSGGLSLFTRKGYVQDARGVDVDELGRGQYIAIGSEADEVSFRTPGGYGIEAIAIDNPSGGNTIANCFVPPQIEITGGSGSNATAVALIDYSTHKLTNIVITCRGEGYGEGDTITVNIRRPGNTLVNNKTAVTLSTNMPGTVVFNGGKFALYSQPDFDGTYMVKSGWAVQTTATAGSPKVSAIVVGGTNQFLRSGAIFQVGSGNATASAAKSNIVNPAATITLGTADGPGELWIPNSAAGEAAAFSQRFSKMTVHGGGNYVRLADGDQRYSTTETSAKLILDAIEFEEGGDGSPAKLIIPNALSLPSVKVYVNDRTKWGTTLDNVVFRELDPSTGEYVETSVRVASGDGQLTPPDAVWVCGDAAGAWGTAANWDGGVFPNVNTKARFTNRVEQTVTTSGRVYAHTLDVYNGDLSTAADPMPTCRTFAGDIEVVDAIFRTGTNVVTGTLTLVGDGDEAHQSYTRVGTSRSGEGIGAVLEIADGGVVSATNVHAICMGRHDEEDNMPSSGRVVLCEGGRLLVNTGSSTATMAGLMLGAATGESVAPWYASSYLQKGGYAKLGRLVVGYESNAVASVAMKGGVMELPLISESDTRFCIGHKGYGSFQMFGGYVCASTNRPALSVNRPPQTCSFEVGSGNPAASGLVGAAYWQNGGLFRTPYQFKINGGPIDDENGVPIYSEGVNPVCATLDGNARMEARIVFVGANRGDGAAELNLNGGNLETLRLAAVGRTGRSVVNANGGEITFPLDASTEQFLRITNINVYAGGLAVDTRRGYDQNESGEDTTENGDSVKIGSATAEIPLRVPGGNGVDSVSIDNKGTHVINNCFVVPQILLSGGGGSNATAIALVNYETHQLTNIVVTCRGEGYTSAPTVTILRPGRDVLTGATYASATITPNEMGRVVLSGGRIVLYSQPEFTGVYEVRRGIAIQSMDAGAGSPNVSAIYVGGTNQSLRSGAVFRCGAANATATEANWNPVNPAATLHLGTEHGSGVLMLPNAASGQVEPFSQRFEKLVVSGTGNSVMLVNGGSNPGGSRLNLGTVEFADSGAKLELPDFKADFRQVKVYVEDESLKGKIIQNITFKDRIGKVGYVTADGQIVPFSGMFMMYN